MEHCCTHYRSRLEAEKGNAEEFEMLLSTCKKRLLQEGVSLLQMLKVLDENRSGILSMSALKRAINLLPLEFSGNQLARQFEISVHHYEVDSANVRYIDWIEALMLEDPFGLVDNGVFRGFSLRSALRVVDTDDDGRVSRKQVTAAFRSFFEFLMPTQLEAVVQRVCPQDGVDLLDMVWTFDMAFGAAKGHAYAVKNFQKATLAQGEDGTIANPFAIIKLYLERKSGRMMANIRKLCHKYD